jgi:hypothetical protein
MQVQEPSLLNQMIQYITLGLQKEVYATALQSRMFRPLYQLVQKRASAMPSAREQNKLGNLFVILLFCYTIADRLL